jgi:NAD(P)-dependent dehydrogenase (short-subunit alcohol dehydrogenase family)
MAEKAQERVQALTSHLSNSSSSSSSSLPEIKRVAGPSNAPRLAGKVAIITGTNSPLGIGRATAHQYAESGAKAIYICDFDDTHLKEHKREIESKYAGVEVHARQFDASNETAVKAVVDEAMDRYGRLDVFFANAGIIGPHSLFTDCSDEDFMEVLKVNTLR